MSYSSQYREAPPRSQPDYILPTVVYSEFLTKANGHLKAEKLGMLVKLGIQVKLLLAHTITYWLEDDVLTRMGVGRLNPLEFGDYARMFLLSSAAKRLHQRFKSILMFDSRIQNTRLTIVKIGLTESPT